MRSTPVGNMVRLYGVIASLAFICVFLGSADAAQLALTWTDASSNEDGFRIERKTGPGGSYATIASPAAGTTSFVDGTVSAGTTYCYRVNAWNSAGASPYSNEACATPAAPTLYGLTASRAGAGSGTVASSPAGIACGTDCSESYPAGTSVALSATPAPGSTFAGWSGACSGPGTCVVVLDSPKSLTATFALATSTLTVATAGTGAGTVTSTPAGVICGTDCSESYPSGTNVTLTAAPATGSTFAGWSGACTGGGPCTVSMTAARSVTATFTTVTYSLVVSKAGTGDGLITSNPNGVDCGSDCSQSYPNGTNVTLTAAPATGSTFTGWSGACAGTGSTCTVTMSAARTATATFTAQAYALTVIPAGAGAGVVISNPGGINCPADCSETYGHGTNVTLTATAGIGATFTGWSGACTGGGPCTVSMTAARSVTATFTLAAMPTPSSYTLSVSKTGSGAGIVASNPAGINCGSTCNAAFAIGTNVTLEIIPDAGSTFAGWTGACSGTGTCTVAMNQARNVTATFALQNFSLSVLKSGGDSGTVTSSPSGIVCGSDCNETYSYNTSVTLTATSATGATFTGWSGDCAGTAPTCTVAMNRARAATANFIAQEATYTLKVSRNGRGSGSVTSTPTGIACARDCRENFASGTNVTLIAEPAAGSIFAGWSGACSGTGTCAVTLTHSTSVTAWFTRPRR